MIGIQKSENSFSERWISYCEAKGISYRVVDCYHNNITSQLNDCDALMWHHNHMNPRDLIFAKQLLFAAEHLGIVVFPNFNTNWHFDDKLGQKYLLELLNCPFVNTYVYYNKHDALSMTENTKYPKVFKLRGGGGSWNVFLVKNKHQATHLINKAFRNGFKQYNALNNIKERWRKFCLGKINIASLIMGFIRVFFEPAYSKVQGKEIGYVYFQDFIPGNDSDIRVIVIDGKAFAIKRMVRKNDFRASGSGNILYKKELFDEKIIRLAFDVASKLQTQCIAFDFIHDQGIPKIVEISYGFVKEGYDACEGYWDKNLQWHPGKFDPCTWMVDLVVKQIEAKKQKNDF